MKSRATLLLISLSLSAAAGLGVSFLWTRPWASTVPATAGGEAPARVPDQSPDPAAAAFAEDDAADLAPDRPRARPDLRHLYCANPFRVTCGTEWPSLDPTGKVRPDVTGEVRALRFMRDLIQEHPHWTSEQVQEELARRIYTDVRRRRAEDGFRWVLRELRAWIRARPDRVLSPAEKDGLLERLDRLTLELPPPATVYGDAIDLITKNTVYYERTPQGALRLRIGGAYLLNATSWFNVVYTFAHEVAHAIDPCEAEHGGVRPRAYEPLIACFVKSGWVDPARSRCGPNEQISEIFADWIAAELVGRAIEETGRDYAPDDRARAAINAGRDLCEQIAADPLNLHTHQHPQLRIGTIIGRSVAVRRALACRNLGGPAYCRLQAPEEP